MSSKKVENIEAKSDQKIPGKAVTAMKRMESCIDESAGKGPSWASKLIKKFNDTLKIS